MGSFIHLSSLCLLPNSSFRIPVTTGPVNSDVAIVPPSFWQMEPGFLICSLFRPSGGRKGAEGVLSNHLDNIPFSLALLLSQRVQASQVTPGPQIIASSPLKFISLLSKKGAELKSSETDHRLSSQRNSLDTVWRGAENTNPRRLPLGCCPHTLTHGIHGVQPTHSRVARWLCLVFRSLIDNALSLFDYL